MVLKFEGNFFSKENQKARFANVGATLKAAVTGKGVASNTGAAGVDKVLSTLASNPFGTALVGAGAVSIAKIGLPATLQAATTKKALAGVVATPIVGSIVGNVGVKESATAVAKVPKDLANFTSNITGAITGNNGVKDIFAENPLLATGVTGGLALFTGKAISNTLNTIATNKNTQTIKDLIKDTTPVLPPTQDTSFVPPAKNPPVTTENSSNSQMLPVLPQTQTVTKSKKSTSRRRRRPTVAPSQTLNVKIYNQTRSQTNKFIKMIR